MTLWIILTAMSSAAAVLVAIPLIRRYEQIGGEGQAATRIYIDQLAEIERDRVAGDIGEDQAALAKLEIQRRLLIAAKAAEPAAPVPRTWKTVALVAVTAFVALGSANIYDLYGRPDLAVESQGMTSAATTSANTTPPVQLPATGAGNVDSMISKLAAKLQQSPNDAEGWRMLGWSYFNTQHYAEAAEAYAKASALAPGNAGYKSAYAEALVQAAGGIVTPAARALFETALASDAKEERSRFYMALASEQAGKETAALDLWIALLQDAPKDAGWLGDVRAHVESLGQKTGRDVSALLASAAPPPAASPDMGVAGADQQAAVEAMVGKLQARLANNPVDRDGWAMLIRSLKVKGDAAGAAAALSKALEVFRNDPATRDQIALMARALDVGGHPSDAAPAAMPAITQDAIAAAAAMPAQDQQAMISGMVDGLAQKLQAAPHDADGWKRLIRSRMVLNQPELARQALQQAMTEFTTDSTTKADIASLARQLGVAVE